MIASLLVLLPLLGYSQRLSDLGNQDRRLEEIFGQSAHSRRLPSSFVASGVPSSRGGESLSAHVMYVPPMNLFAGDYYFLEDGAANVVKHYPDYYFRSAEYCGVNGSVYGYVADLTWGFCKVDLEDGTVTRLSDVPMAMNDLTFDYSHGLMLGTKDGRIYSVNYDESSAMPGQAGSPLYDYSTVAGGPMFLTVAADLLGHLYAVEYDESDASLYRFDITESGLENMTEVGSTGYPAKKLQTMAFDHKTGSLYWWQTSDSGSNFLTVDVETGAATAVVADIGTQMTGLILDFEYREYAVTVDGGIEGAEVTTDVASAYPGAEIKVYVDVDGCYSLEGLTYTAGGVEYPIDTTGLAAGYCTFYMPAADVEVGASLEQAEYAVRFYAMDSVTVVKADTVACGTSATAPADSQMAVSCYDFTGWAQGFDEVTSDLDVYPEYSVKTVNVVVHYEYADGSEAAEDYDDYFDCNSEFSVPSPAIPCHTASDTLISGTVNDTDEFEYTVTYTQNMHGVTLSPESLDASAGTVTVSANPAGCGDTDTISYAINDGYALEALAVVGNSGDTVSYTQGDGEARFDMPDVDVTVSYTVSEITVDSIANICIDGSVTAPGTSVAVPTYLLRMQGEEDWESYTAAGLEEHVFDTAGTYDYRVQLTNGFGEFYTATRQFTVYGRSSVAIEGNPYICAGSPIELSVSGELAGTFQWYRNGTAIEGATGSTYSVSAAASSDAGSYTVDFTSADSCTFTSDVYAVNVMSLPFAPAIGNESGEAICYGTSAELYFDHGVIDPSDYSYQWFVADSTGVYDTIPGATDWRYATPALTENTGYKIVIRYANEYECESEGTYEVTVKPNVEIQFAGDTVTCMGVNPQNNPAVSPAQASGFTGFAWYFDGVSIPTETGSELHFENYDLDLVDTIGYHTITVTVTSEDGCQYTGEESFYVNQLPTVSLSDGSGHESYINGTVYNDHEYAEFYVCSGTELNLRASGDATGYEWSTGVEGVDSITLTVTEPMEISVTGYNGETGCGNTVYMTVNVNELPAVSITMPAADTTYSMINGDFTFSATPEGGVYTVDGEELESNVMNPYQFGQGEHTVVYTYEDDSLCVNSDTVTVILDKPYWTDEGIYDSMWYALSAANDRYEVANAAELGALGRQVLDGNDFSGITVWLVNDIDLEGYFWPTFEGASFAGTFDGIGKVISNMYVREDTVAMELTGTFRNLGVKDPTVISDAAEGTVSLQCEFTNGYATGIDSLNVTVDPSGAELDNFYATFAGAGNQFAAYIAGNAAPEAYAAAETGDLLQTLQDWVFVENSETYRDWVSDGDGANYGYPVMDLSFLPYNLITVLPFEGEYEVGGDAQTRVISDSLSIDYAYEGDMVDISFTIDQYSIIDSVQYTTDSLTWYSLAVDADAVSFEMPDTSIYVKVYMSRDYWTNAGNYDEEWYGNCIIEDRYEIGSNEELAAMLWEINNGNDFDSITLYVTSDIDMTGHLWPNVKTFKGVFDGNGHIISDIVMRETCDSLNVNAGVIRNVGIQDLDVKGAVVLNNNGSFLNSYFSYDPATTLTTKDDFKVNTPTSGNRDMRTFAPIPNPSASSSKLSVNTTSANVTSPDRSVTGDSQLTYCTGDFISSIGVGGGTYIEWAAAFRPGQYTADDNFVTSVDFYSYAAATYTLKIYDGEPTAAIPANLLYSHDYEVAEANVWVNLPIYNAVVEIDHTKALWVAVGATDPAYPATYSNEVLSTTDCCMMYFQSQWLPITDLGSFQIQPWMIAANTTSDNPGVQCEAISTFPYFNDFEDFTTNHGCWISIDNDGDGQDWITGTTQSGASNGYNYSTGLVSKSYDYNGSSVSYDADNYLLSPEFELPAGYLVTLSWYAWSTYGQSYPDHYEVMIAPNGSTEISDFVSVFSEDGPADWAQRTVDISAYAGTTVRVVFHHQDYDQYWIVIDNLGIETAFDCSGYGFPFAESFENGLDCWGTFDEDGDGRTWQLAAGQTGNGAQSVSWSSATGSLNPDNWLVSPEITIPSGLDEVTLAWKVKGASTSYIEHYGVYVSTTGDQPADFTTQVYEGQSTTTTWTDVTVDMTAYAGQTIRIAFRHYDSYDMMNFIIDNISIKSPLPCNDITEFPYFNDFENFLDEKHCWIDIDNDGDGYGWFTDTQAYGTAGFGVDGSNCLISQSYDNNIGSRDADNYLLSPEVVFPADSTITLSWFERSLDGSYPDSYEVMIAPNGSTEISDFVSIYSGEAAYLWTERTADLSAYAGTTVRVVFHHQSSDCYKLGIDNMSITVGSMAGTMENVYESDGEAIYVYGTEVGTDIETLNAWVEAANSADYLNWVTDDAMANYGFPVHGVRYTPKHQVVVNYLYATDETVAAPAAVETYEEGEDYEIESPEVTGFTPDQLAVEGTMGAENDTINVYYTVNAYTLTVNYVGAPDSIPSHVEDFDYLAEYSVISPEVEGYEPDMDTVSGNMPATDTTITVTYGPKTYNIIIDSTIVNATVTTNPALTATTGATVTITVTPDPGYRIDCLTYNGTAIDVTVEPYTFEMPAMDVVIYATVVEAYWTDPEIRDLTWYNTTDSEFTLTDPHELGGLSALVSGLDELEADDFEGKTITIAADMDLTMYKWRPIGAQVNSVWYFQGTFEGNGYAITNMNTAEDNGSYQAFFGNIGENGVVNDVNVEGKATGHYFTAGIAGSNLGYIYNSTANVTVTSEFEAGGIVAWNQGTVENCYNTGSVECTSAGTRSNYYVGGIVAQNNGFIYNSHNVGELISGNGSNPVFYYGGIAGYNDGEVDSCYWNGYGEGIGQNEGEMSGCSSFELEDAGVVSAMSYYANDHYTSEHPLYAWTMGEDGYPVFGEMMRGSILNVVEDAVSVMLYPNPAKDVVKIVSEGIRNITVYDVFGQVILSTDTDASEASINLGRNAAGVYVVKVVTANGVATRNIILE